MPEGLEAEIWRLELVAVVGRTISDVWVDERVADPGIVDLFRGRAIVEVRRHGKVVVLHTDGPSLGLHFGMTGRVIVDGHAAIERLEYASGADDPAWDRCRLYTGSLSDPPAVRMNDPRRLGRITLDPDLSSLGPDMFDVDVRTLRRSLAGKRTSIKVALLDQRVIAGLGNLCADEILWWSAIAPQRSVAELADSDVKAIAVAMRRRLGIMLRRGGSTTGELTPARRAARGPCPRDGHELERVSLHGRTAVWCPHHQT